MSAASSRATRSGSSARRIDSSAATGTSTRRRTAASSSTVRQGCSTYSSPPPGRAAATIRTAVSTSQRAVGVHPDPPVRAERVPHRLDPREVLALGLAGLGDLHLRGPAAVRRPDDVRRRLLGPTAGTVTFTGTDVRTGAGQPASAASRAAASHGTHSAAS